VSATAYFDASWNDSPNGVMTVGGFLSSEKRWLWFEREWKKLLIKWRVGYFRMEEFAHFHGQFADWENREPDRQAFLAEAIDIIARTAWFSFSCSMLLADWEFCNEGFTLEENLFRPYPLCGWNVVDHVLWWCERQKRPYPKDQVLFVFEKGDPDQDLLRKAVDRDFNIEIATEKKIPDNIFRQPLGALQAADFVSWHCRNVAKKADMGTLEKYRVDFEKLFERVPFYPHHTHLSMTEYPKELPSGPNPPDGRLFAIRNQTGFDEASLVRFCHLRKIPLRPGFTLWKKKTEGSESGAR
jgi:hypothetical protein